MQYDKIWCSLAMLELPNKYLVDNADNVPKIRSERMYAGRQPGWADVG